MDAVVYAYNFQIFYSCDICEPDLRVTFHTHTFFFVRKHNSGPNFIFFFYNLISICIQKNKNKIIQNKL